MSLYFEKIPFLLSVQSNKYSPLEIKNHILKIVCTFIGEIQKSNPPQKMHFY